MKSKLWILTTFAFLLSGALQAGVVRTVYANNEKMEPIYYSLGKSSILRFTERPKKVVVGNKNYFQIEFIGNDVTIQPLGQAHTNVFVYTEYQVYGFLLRPTNSRYDDLVNVRWKSKNILFKNKEKPKQTKPLFRPIKLKMKGHLDINVTGVSQSQINNDLYFVDIVIKNTGKKNLLTKDIQIFATRNNKKLSNQNAVFKSENLKMNDSVIVRMFIGLKQKRGFTLNTQLNKKKAKVIISKKYL